MTRQAIYLILGAAITVGALGWASDVGLARLHRRSAHPL